MKEVAVSWSGGKDSCFAAYQAQGAGLQISYLLNMISQEFQRSGGHGVERGLMQLQAQAVGIPMLQREFGRDNYEQVFREALRWLKGEGIEGLATGDIYLQENRDWVERVCREEGLSPVMPLWGKDSEQVIVEFIKEGFQAVVVALQADLLDKGFLGRSIDAQFLSAICRLGGKVDPCGEKGEFHTFVLGGPLFQHRVEILETDALLRDGRWFLDVQRYQLASVASACS